MPKAVSIVIQMMVKRRNPRLSTLGKANHLVWVLSKTGLNEDIVRAFPEGSDAGLRVMRVNRTLAKGVTKAFLKCAKDNDYPIAVASAPDRRAELRTFWAATLKTLCEKANIRLIVGGNWRFWGERDLAAAACSCGIPFVVLHKECFKTKAQSRNALHVYRNAGRFEGSHLLTYNKHEKILLLEADVAEEDRIIVTGAPRFDALHELRRARARRQNVSQERPKLVCFAISPHAGLALDPMVDCTTTVIPTNWLNLCEESLSTWRQVALQRPNLDVVVKVKVGPLNTRPVESWWRRGRIPFNMRLEVGGVATGVLAEANAAVGFNTTAVLDAFACGLQVGVVRYASVRAASPDHLHDYAGLGVPLIDLETTLDWVDRAVVCPSVLKADLDEPVRLLLEEYVGNGDGRAAGRVRAALSQIAGLHHSTLLDSFQLN